jgi:hypothetical protein
MKMDSGLLICMIVSYNSWLVSSPNLFLRIPIPLPMMHPRPPVSLASRCTLSACDNVSPSLNQYPSLAPTDQVIISPCGAPWVHDGGTNIERFHHRGVEATLVHVHVSMTLLQAARDSMVGKLLVCLVHCLARFGFGGVVYACGCRPGWPSASTNCILGAFNGEFTATVATVVSSSTL